MHDGLIIGEYDRIVAERSAVLANVSPAHRWRIRGVRRRPMPAKTHIITVDCRKPEERTVETTAIIVSLPIAAVVRPFRAHPEMPPTRWHIIRAVADAWGVTVDDLCSPKRHRVFAYPRYAAMAMLQERLGWSSPKIGKLLGGRDHSTVITGIKRAKGLRETCPNWRHRYEAAHIALAGGVK
jgi:hypothetical protein